MPPQSRSGGECPKCGSRAAGIMFKCREEGCPRQDEIQEWMLHMDLHLTEHDLPHAGKALRAAWPHVRAYLAGVENERNTWRELAKNAEAKVTALSEKPAQLAPPTQDEIADYRDLFRRELDKNMHNSSSSPSTEAHAIALRTFVDKRNAANR